MGMKCVYQLKMVIFICTEMQKCSTKKFICSMYVNAVKASCLALITIPIVQFITTIAFYLYLFRLASLAEHSRNVLRHFSMDYCVIIWNKINNISMDSSKFIRTLLLVFCENFLIHWRTYFSVWNIVNWYHQIW